MKSRHFLAAFIVSLLAPTIGVGQTPVETDRTSQREVVTFERLLTASQDAANCLTYSGQYNSQRYSRLDQINDETVSKLRVKWVRQFQTQEEVETSPLVVNGVMFLTLAENKVWTLDAESGLPFWNYELPLPDQLSLCCGKINCGLAMLGDTLYMGTFNAQLVALDAKSGNVRWQV